MRYFYWKSQYKSLPSLANKYVWKCFCNEIWATFLITKVNDIFVNTVPETSLKICQFDFFIILHLNWIKDISYFYTKFKEFVATGDYKKCFSFIKKVMSLIFILESFPLFNPFPNTPFWDHPKFKEAADDNWNVATERFQDTDCIENNVDKGEIAYLEQFHLFHNVFLKNFSSLC